jgi:hypothetical protein
MYVIAEDAMERARGCTNENAAAVRVYVDTVKWFASKMAPASPNRRLLLRCRPLNVLPRPRRLGPNVDYQRCVNCPTTKVKAAPMAAPTSTATSNGHRIGGSFLSMAVF